MATPIQPISFEDYDRITDTLMYLSDTLVLSFTVNLSTKTRERTRRFFHSEAEYPSRYIGPPDTLHSVRRSMYYCFKLENKSNFMNSFTMKPNDVAIILQLIENKLFPWIFGNDRIYDIKDDQLVITGNYSPIIYAQSEYQYIKFVPTVCEISEKFKEAIEITVNESLTAIVDIDRFMMFYYTLKNTDMYGVACSLVNYVKIPPYHINSSSLRGLGSGGMIQEFNGIDYEQPQKPAGSAANFLKNK